MKLSEFRRAVAEEFGAAYGRVLTADTVLGALGDRTADEALDEGVAARDVWAELCRAMDVPESRWRGAGRPAPPQG